MNETTTHSITGASRGLGLALARGLAAAGWPLVIDARDAAALDAAAAESARSGRGRSRLAGDITDPAHRAALARRRRRTGGPDLLVNNAGTLGASPLPALADYPIEELAEAFEVNVLAPLALTQLLLPRAPRATAARCSTSPRTRRSSPTRAGAATARPRPRWSRPANVLAAEETTVTVWWVDPGDMRTRMHQEAFPGEDITDRPLPETVIPAFLRLVTERLPNGRYRAAELMPSGVAS